MVSTCWRQGMLVGGFALLLVAVSTGSATAADTLVVDDDENECPNAGYNTIQGAIDAASAGDAVEVCDGTYTETVVVPSGTDSLQLVGRGTPVIDDDGSNYALEIKAQGVVVDGFEIQSNGYAVYVRSDDVVVRNVDVTAFSYGVTLDETTSTSLVGLEASGGSEIGLMFLGADDTTVEDSVFDNNADGGIAVFDSNGNSQDATFRNVTVKNSGSSSNPHAGFRIPSLGGRLVITDSTIKGNSERGIDLGSGSAINSGRIANSSIANNGWSGIYLDSISDYSIRDNQIDGSGRHGIYLKSASGTTIQNNTVADTGYSRVYLEGGSDNTIVENTVRNPTVDAGVFGIYLFDSSSNTVLNNTATDNGWGAYIQTNADGNVIRNNTLTGNEFDGIALEESDNTRIVDNTISRNNKGVHIFETSHNNTIRSNTIRSNTDEGVRVESDGWLASTTVRRNTIVGNGYGVRNLNTSATLDATENWWGDISGPGGSGPGTGDEVSGDVTFAPWLSEALPDTTAPSVVEAVEYDSGHVEVTLSEPVTALSTSDVTVYRNGTEISGVTFAGDDGTTGRVILDLGSDVTPVDSVTVDLDSIADPVGNNADPGNATVTVTGATVNVAASGGGTNTLTTYRGTPVALDFSADYNPDQSYERFADDEFQFAGSTGLFSRVTALDTAGLAVNATHQVDANDDGNYEATVDLHELGLRAAVEDATIETDENLTVEVTADAGNRAVEAVLVPNDTDAANVTKRATLDGSGAVTLAFGTVDRGNYTVRVADERSGVAVWTEPITVREAGEPQARFVITPRAATATATSTATIPPAGTPTATTTMARTSTTTQSPTSTATPESSDGTPTQTEAATEGDGSGFGTAVAVAGLLVAALLAHRRA